MKMTPRDIVLAAIEQAGGMIRGKTLLQKRVYFLDVLLGLNLGYRPYFYGPYSPAIEYALGELEGLNFVEERKSSFRAADKEGFEKKRYDYEITDDGKEILGPMKKRNPDYGRVIQTLQRIQEAGALDYLTLSVAAKAHFIITREGAPMTRDEIIAVAQELKWNIADTQKFERAADFLEKLGLLKRRP